MKKIFEKFVFFFFGKYKKFWQICVFFWKIYKILKKFKNLGAPDPMLKIF